MTAQVIIVGAKIETLPLAVRTTLWYNSSHNKSLLSQSYRQVWEVGTFKCPLWQQRAALIVIPAAPKKSSSNLSKLNSNHNSWKRSAIRVRKHSKTLKALQHIQVRKYGPFKLLRSNLHLPVALLRKFLRWTLKAQPRPPHRSPLSKLRRRPHSSRSSRCLPSASKVWWKAANRKNPLGRHLKILVWRQDLSRVCLGRVRSATRCLRRSKGKLRSLNSRSNCSRQSLVPPSCSPRKMESMSSSRCWEMSVNSRVTSTKCSCKAC